ncbi:MAG: sulfatase [Bryobacterales bacterium]|nr:sulfatase [Bryobacterales bacterium]
MVTRRHFLESAVMAAGAAPAVLAGKPRRPNFVFVLTDEWRAQATHYNGDVNVQAPVLDRLAGESVSFDNAASSCPVCCPARASLMTGQYSVTNGVYMNDVELKPNGITLGQAFTAGGYRTGYIGKWHLYGSPDGHYGRRLAYIPPDHRFGFDYWKACECTHEYNNSLYYEGNDPAPRHWSGYDALAQTDDACRFIESSARARDPFFLCLSLGPPHMPYETAPERYRKQFEGQEIHFRPNVPKERQAEAAHILRGYYAHIAALDECLARLLNSLDRAHIAGDTVFVFTSDHGDMMLSQGLEAKLYPWEESIRVPFLLRYPARFGGRARRFRGAMNTPDVMPTLLGLAGLPVPGSVQGSDLFSTRANDTAFLNLPVPFHNAVRYGFAEYRGLRSPAHTFVRSIHGPWLLYDNRRDPYQMHNLCGNPRYRDVQAKLERELDARLRTLGDEFLPADRYVERAGAGHYRELKVKTQFTRSPWGDWESTLISPPAT